MNTLVTWVMCIVSFKYASSKLSFLLPSDSSAGSYVPFGSDPLQYVAMYLRTIRECMAVLLGIWIQHPMGLGESLPHLPLPICRES